MYRALLIVCALPLNAALAGPKRLYAALGLTELAQYPGALLRVAERRLNREHRSTEEREMRGYLLVAVVIALSLIAGGILEWMLQGSLPFMELLIVTALLPVRPTWDCVAQIRKGLENHDPAQVKQALAHTAWRNYALLDEYGVARAGIETLAVHFSEKIVAPVFWYLLLGLPGLLASKSVCLLWETLAPEQEFGKGAKAAHYILHYLPSRLAALFWLLASVFFPLANVRAVAKQVAAAIGSASPEALSLAAAAAALKLTLGGPSSIYSHAWIGSGTARPSAIDVKRGLRFFALLHLLLFIVVGLLL